MQSQSFEEHAKAAAARDPRYDIDAYRFLRDALNHTLRAGKGGKGEVRSRHIRGPELLNGFRELALNEFGPMALTVLQAWGVNRCEDIGEMVFCLVEIGAFGTTAEDSREDFKGGYDFAEAFVRPFLPTAPVLVSDVSAAILTRVPPGRPRRGTARRSV